ncbi:Alpha/Beta hydrolase protein [Collybia nuda]|uniref:Alpha/Beta hydrolase protein n=1 Tax=Collybia nuda TaxID=64659 RepID=A0A9P5XVN4_9AGAR|nr:Alpha/Beta hydrolase protein [Collybia nuda]
MRTLSVFVIFGLLSGLINLSWAQKQHIGQDLFKDLVYYWKYATSAYFSPCLSPNGKVLLGEFSEGGTQGYIARDDAKRAIVVAFRGSEPHYSDWVDTNLDFLLVPYKLTSSDTENPLINTAPIGVTVHKGFLEGVVHIVMKSVRDELAKATYKEYRVITVGHSLGGSLASLAAVSLRDNLPGTYVSMFTYGQPRTGNTKYAGWVNKAIGRQFSAHRVTRVSDGVTVLPPKSVKGIDTGYRHHGLEYYQSDGGISAQNVSPCKPGADLENPDCPIKNSFNITETGRRHSEYLGSVYPPHFIGKHSRLY